VEEPFPGGCDKVRGGGKEKKKEKRKKKKKKKRGKKTYQWTRPLRGNIATK
jgi:hypothetical protein